MFLILYVDDEPGLLEIGKLFLESGGDFSVETAVSAYAALDRIRDTRFDAIVSDYQMPGMDGIAFLKMVRSSDGGFPTERAYQQVSALPRRQHATPGDTPFILFTGRGREQVVIEAINSGVDFYIQKGGEPKSQFAELGHKIRQAVQRRRAEEDLRASNEQIAAAEEELRAQLEELIRSEREIKESREELLERSTTLEALLNAIPDVIGVQDPHHNIIRYNDAGYGLLGQTPQSIAGKKCYELIGHDTPCAICATTETYRTRKPAQVEKYVPEMGIWMDVRSYPVLDSHGQIRFVIEHLRDITQSKRAEEALRESERNYRNILESIQDVFYRTDARGTLMLISPSGVALLGYTTADEMIGRPALDFYADSKEREKFLEKIRLAGTVSQMEVTLKRRDGTPVAVSTSSHVCYDAGKNFDGVEGIFRDITRFKETQAQLRESAENYRILVQHIQEGVFLMQEGQIVFCNPVFAEMIGYFPDEMAGIPVPLLAAPEDREMVMEHYRSWLAGKPVPANYEFRMLHKDGTIRVPVRMSVGIGMYRGLKAIIGTVRKI